MKNIRFLIIGIGLVILCSSTNAADVTRLTFQPETETTAQIESLIKSMDKNKNGKIEFDEMYSDGIVSAYQLCENVEKMPVLSDVDSAKFTNICTLYNFKKAMFFSIIVNGKVLMEQSSAKQKKEIRYVFFETGGHRFEGCRKW